MSHTPGPWERCQANIHGKKDGKPIAAIMTHMVPLEESLANAKLIAAAPDLLGILRRISVGQQIDGTDLNRDDMVRLARVVINTAGL